MFDGQLQEFKDSADRKEYQLQLVEKRLKEYEYFLQEIAVYDDFVRSKLEELKINVEENVNPDMKISNVVFQNKKL